MPAQCSSGTAQPDSNDHGNYGFHVATEAPGTLRFRIRWRVLCALVPPWPRSVVPCDNRRMNSKRALGVAAVVVLAAAVWAVARVAQRPAVSPQTTAAAPPPSSSDANIALQFYSDPAPVGAIAM